MNEREQNFTIAESYCLPSKGLIYDVPVNQTVELRSMTARDEMKRQNPSSTPFKTLSDIIEGCMIEKPAIHVYDMALGDYEFLLHKLRIVTYGSNYHCDIMCNTCGEMYEANIDLEDLEVKEFDQEKFEELRTFELPKSKDTVTIKFQTPHMLDEIEVRAKEMKRKYKNAELNFDLLVLLTAVIDTINGNKINQLDLEDYVKKMPAMDMTKIVNNLNKLNSCVGINTEYYTTCEKCGAEVRTFFRYREEFFRPTDI